jgi:hypothetical protein
MRKIGFIGAYDKIDCILYIAKILRTLGKKVLIIDSTIAQKARYIVPAINPTISYVTEFEEMDVAVGFENLITINRYLGIPEEKELPYDYVLIDIDNADALESFEINEKTKNYFVTAFDLYSLKKGLEILINLKEPLNLTKILFSRDMSKEEDDYLNFLSLEYKVIWGENRIYFPLENGDASVIAENQRVAKIKFKPLSIQYKDSLMYIAEELLKDVSGNEIRRAVKFIEKGV